MTPTGRLTEQLKRESQAKHDYLDREICRCPEPLRASVYLGVWRCKLCGGLIR